jgi:predicted HTH transcriptional regulator
MRMISCSRDALQPLKFWGRGYEKIRESFDQAHLQVPTFEQVRGGFMATIQREIFQKVQSNPITTDGTSQEIGQKSTLIDTLKGTRKSIMVIISNNPTITLDQIASQLGKNPRGIDKHVKILRELGVLRRVDGNNGGHWEIIK